MAAHPFLRRAPAALLALVACAVLAQQATPQPRRAGPPRPPRVPELNLPAAPGEQMAAAAMAHFGVYECEFDEKVSVDVNRRFDGYLDVRHRHRTWVMKPVLSHTGALRLEDVRGRMLMLQIADKSMIMDTQIGQRVVDKCVHEKQREEMAARKAAGTQEDSIGIDPAKAAAPSAVAAASAAAAGAASGAASVSSGVATAASAAPLAPLAPTAPAAPAAAASAASAA